MESERVDVFSAAPPVNKKTEIVIIGAGLTGLATVVSFLHESKKNNNVGHYNITLIEKRNVSDFNRRNRVIVSETKSLYEIDKTRWDTFCQKVFDPEDQYVLNKQGELMFKKNKDEEPVVLNENALNKRQKFLRKLMRQLKDPDKYIYKNFSIKELQNAMLEYIQDYIKEHGSLPHKINIAIEDLSSITNIEFNPMINLVSVTLTTKDNKIKKIPVNELLICEGANRENTNKFINPLLKSHGIPPFSFSLLKNQPPKYNFSMHLTLDQLSDEEWGAYKNYQHIFFRNVDKDVELRNNVKEILVNELGYVPPDGYRSIPYVWDSNIHPFFSSTKDPRIFLAVPISKELFDEADKEILFRVAQCIATLETNLPPECFIRDPALPDVNLFEREISASDKPFVSLGNTQISLAGDTLITPEFGAGFSSTLGLQMGTLYPQYFLSNGKTQEHMRFKIIETHKAQVQLMENHLKKEEASKMPTIKK